MGFDETSNLGSNDLSSMDTATLGSRDAPSMDLNSSSSASSRNNSGVDRNDTSTINSSEFSRVGSVEVSTINPDDHSSVALDDGLTANRGGDDRRKVAAASNRHPDGVPEYIEVKSEGFDASMDSRDDRSCGVAD